MKRHHKQTNFPSPKSLKTNLPSKPIESELIPSTSKENINDGDKSVKIREYPIIWSEQQWLERKEKHKWLICKNGYLGCSECLTVNALIPHKTHGLYLSIEWINCKVNFNGLDKIQQLRSLRTKISAHQASKTHKKAHLILTESQKKYFDNFTSKEQKLDLNKVEKIFNTAYYVAKNDVPLSDYEHLIQLQLKNGIEFVPTLETHLNNVNEIINFIASEFKKKFVSKLVTEEKKISIIMDETTIGKLLILLIYVKTVLDDTENVIFLDLIFPNDQKSIPTEFFKCLDSHKINKNYLHKNLICLSFDGTNETLRKTADQIIHDQLKQTKIIIWPCLNHRLELSIQNSIESINTINNIENFITQLYNLCNQFPSNWIEIKTQAPNLSVQLTKISQGFDINSISSCFQTIDSLWTEYHQLHYYLKNASNEMGKTKNEKKKYNYLSKSMESIEFLKDLSLIYDILHELSTLSLQLEEENCFMNKADKLIRQTISIIANLKNKPGEKENEIIIASKKMNYKGINLKCDTQIVNLNRTPFIKSILNGLESRCFIQTRKAENLLKDFEILNPQTWLIDSDIRYGEDRIKSLCSRFRLENNRFILNGFRDYLNGGGCDPPKQLDSLINAIKTIPCNTNECEKGLRSLKIILSKHETKHSLMNTSSLMFIKLNGPPLSLWNATPYVKSWSIQYNHSIKDIKTNVKFDDLKMDKTEICKFC